VRRQRPLRHDPRLGAGLRHRRGGLFACHPAARAGRTKPLARENPSLCHRYRRGGAGGGSRPPLSPYPAAKRIARSAPTPPPVPLRQGLRKVRPNRFSIPEGPSSVSNKSTRDVCVFSPHSVLRDPPFSRMDLISCRNLLIYLNSELQTHVIPILHYALKPNGFLFLGTSENVTQHGDLFSSIDKKSRIFQRRGGGAATAPPPPTFLPPPPPRR